MTDWFSPLQGPFRDINDTDLQLGPCDFCGKSENTDVISRVLCEKCKKVLCWECADCGVHSSLSDFQKFIRRYTAQGREVYILAESCPNCQETSWWEKYTVSSKNNETIKSVSDRVSQPTDEIICGRCGKPMMMREVAPCLDCGGNPQELEHLKSGQHSFLMVELLGNEILCDFCYSDILDTDPLYWGFPKEFEWEENLYSSSQELNFQKITNPRSLQEMACPNEKCRNTLRKQQFVIENAKRHGVTLPQNYWPYLNG